MRHLHDRFVVKRQLQGWRLTRRNLIGYINSGGGVSRELCAAVCVKMNVLQPRDREATVRLQTLAPKQIYELQVLK